MDRARVFWSCLVCVCSFLSSATVRADLIVEYTFADGNAATATNTGSLGATMNGTITGGSIVASPMSADNMALELGGAAGNGIAMPNQFDFASEFTISMLARLDSYPVAGTGSILFDDFGGPGVLISTDNSNRLRLRLSTTGGADTFLLAPNIFPLGVWQSIVAVYDGSKAYLLQNGAVVDSANATGLVSNSPAVTPNIGVESGDVAFPWDGAIDDFSISTVAIAIPEPSSVAMLGLLAAGLTIASVARRMRRAREK